MPSKENKKTKSDRSPIINRTTPSPKSEPNLDVLHFQKHLSRAAAKFPNFIGEDAFVGRVCDHSPNSSKEKNKAWVWLPRSYMISSSIVPGSLVSVSLPAIGEESLSNFPLDSLFEECVKHFRVDAGGKKFSGAGNYFAIANAFPSSEVLKNRVTLSWGLSCTIGVPDAGRPVFVFPMRSFDHLNKNGKVGHLYPHKCTDLYLNLVPPKPVQVTSIKGPSNNGISRKCVNATSENGTPASSKTPLSQLQKPHGSLLSTNSSICQDISSVRLALADQKSNELLPLSTSIWLHGRYLLNGNIVTVPLMFQNFVFIVEGIDKLSFDEIQVFDSGRDADVAHLVGTQTKLHISDPPMPSAVENPSNIDFSKEDPTFKKTRDTEGFDVLKLGGLSKEVADLKEILKFSLAIKGDALRYKGVLLHGPPGTGKTSLAVSCARDVGASLFTINGPEIISQYFGESEQALHEVFESARRAAPAVVFIDELDAIAPARKDGGEELSIRMVATLTKCMDEIKDDGVLVIAATNRPDSIDPAMRRPGRLDREIEIGVPSPEQRLDILRTILSIVDHSLSDDEVQDLASSTHGFVGADLAALCNEAAKTTLLRNIELINSHRHSQNSCLETDHIDSLSSSLSELAMSPNSPISSQSVNESADSSYELIRTNRVEEAPLLIVTAEDFEQAKMRVKPSAMREVILELPKVRWEDVGGQQEVKKQLIEVVQWPLAHPDAYKRIGIRSQRGLLMIGPPGCSKTLMARAVASEAKLNFLAVKGPELFSKWVGESEKAVRSLFAKARANAPAIIFFDEIDGLATSRGQGDDGTSVTDRVLSQLLEEMDGLGQRNGVTVIAATNRPDKIDPALLRPGRFDRLVDVQPPDETDREEIFCIHTRSIPCHADVSMKELARLTEGYTGADIKLVCREAAISALEESFDISEVSMEHFKIGIEKVHPTDVRFYKELATEYRRFVQG